MQRFRMRVAAEQPLVFHQRFLDLDVLRQYRRPVRDSEPLRGLAFGYEKIPYAVFGHDARGFLCQRAPQVLSAAWVFFSHRTAHR